MAEVEFELRQWTSPFQHYGPAFWKTIFLSEWGSGCFQDDSSALHSLFTFSSVQSLSRIQLLATPWTAACQDSLFFTIFQSLLKLMSFESIMPSNYLILCSPLFLPSVFPSIRVFYNELVLCIRWPNHHKTM